MTDRATPAGDPAEELVEVRGNAALYGLVALAAGSVAAAYAWRAVHQGGVLAWLVTAALAVVAVVHLLGWLDARSPRLVADRTGLRFRRGRTWMGAPWSQVETVEVDQGGILRDGSLRLRTENDRETYVRVGATSRSSADLLPSLQALGAPVALAAKPHADDQPPGDGPLEADSPGPVVRALRLLPQPASRRAARADVHRDGPASVGMLALQSEPTSQPVPLPELSELRPASARADLKLEAEPAGQPLQPPVQAHPAPPMPMPTPIVGSQLQRARERLGVSVDELAARTRIRPHVIESIEADDFVPCGGDFYARGHLRSMSRVLGVDPAPILEAYDETYASAPIPARQVFEAELATGPQAALRATSGGPNWAALLAVVLVLVLLWGVARLLLSPDRAPGPDTPAASSVPSAPVSVDPGRFSGLGVAPATTLTLSAKDGSSPVVVRGADGSVAWRGTLSPGQQRRVRVERPATVVAGRGGVVSLAVDGRDRGRLGQPGQPARARVGAGTR